MLVAALALFVYPIFLVRKRLKREGKTAALGFLQDLFVVVQPLFVLWGVQRGFGWDSSWLLVGLGTLYFLINFIVFFDALVFRETALRVDGSILWMIKDVRCFLDSAKKRGLLRIIAAFLSLPSYLGLSLFLFRESLLSVGNASGAALMMALIAFAAAASYFFYKKEDLYRFENPILRLERGFLKGAFSWCNRKKSVGEVRRFGAASERCHYVNSEAPLLKYTEGFTGEKQCKVTCRKGERPHVIFLFLESFRTNDISAFGAHKGLTPRFDSLAKEGVLFKNFYANGLPSFQAVVSSLFGIPTVMDEKSALIKGEMPLISIAQILRQHGYGTTYGVGGPLQFDNQRGFYTKYGFDRVIGRSDVLASYPQAEMTSWGVHDEYFFRHVLDFLEQRREMPQFLSLFSLSNHEPWVAPENFTPPALSVALPEVCRRFLTTLHYTDHCLGLFVDLLKERGLSKDVILFAMGDHGFPMGEHDDNFILQRYLYEENVHVPLLIYADGRIEDPKEMDCVCSQTDLFPTVMDLLDLKGINHSVGSSLLRQCEEREAFFYNPYVYQYAGLRKGSSKVIQTKMTSKVELYDLDADPEERNNLAAQNPKVLESLLERIGFYEGVFTSLSQNRAFVQADAKSDTDGGRILDLSYQLTLRDDQLDATSKRFPYLQELNLSNCCTITDRGVLHFLDRCPYLLSLNLSHCIALSEEVLGGIFQKSKGLEELKLEFVPLKGSAFQSLEKGLESLRLLKLKGGALLDDKALERVTSLCPHVQDVSLSCSNLSIRGLDHLLQSWSLKLIALDEGGHIAQGDFERALQEARGIEGLSLIDFKVTDRLLFVVKELSIQVLSMDFSNSITDEGLKNLYQAPIKHLNLGYPDRVSLKGALALRDSLPFLRSFYFQGIPLCLNSKPTD